MSGEPATDRPSALAVRPAASHGTSSHVRTALVASLAGLAGAAALSVPGPASGQDAEAVQDAIVFGTVRSPARGAPMPDVAVRFLEADYTMVTAEDGAFHADHLPPGRHTVELRYMGLASEPLAMDLAASDVVELTFEVEVDPMKSQQLQVAASGTRHEEPVSGFWRRRTGGGGVFLDRSALAAMDGRPVTSVLRSLRGVAVARCEPPAGADVFGRSLTAGGEPGAGSAARGADADGADEDGPDRRRGGEAGARTDTEGIARPDVSLPAEDPDLAFRPGCQTVWLRGGGDRCRPGLYVQGRLVVATDGDATAVDDLLTGLRARDLNGIEVYRTAAQTPPLFQRSGDACGAVVLWMRGEETARAE